MLALYLRYNCNIFDKFNSSSCIDLNQQPRQSRSDFFRMTIVVMITEFYHQDSSEV